MDQAARGKKLLTDGKFEDAIAQFDAALKVSPTSPDYLIQRSTAHQRAKQYNEALTDANHAILNAQKRAKRELIVEGQFRRGCALFSLERYGDAEFAFGVVKRMDDKHKMVPTWIQKTKMALDKLDDGDARRQCNIEETPTLKQAVPVESSTFAPVANGSSTSTNGTTSTTSPPQQTAPDKIRHEWYQNSETVYFTLLAKGVPKDKAQVDIQERSLTISFPLINGSSYDLTLEPLFGAVKPDKCIPRILSTKIEIILVKATPGQKWSALEANESISESTKSTEDGAEDPKDDTVKRAVFTDSKPAGPAYPTSAKSGPKDWDKITKDLKTTDSDGKEKSLDDDDDYEGGDEANHFFKKLFKNASPETQRAMMKSYTESNGTALSTNWDEVQKAPVETLPPDGMEAKKW